MGGSAVQGSLRARAPSGVRLIETMLWEPGRGVALAPFHWARLAASCAALGIARVPGAAEALVAAVAGEAPKRLRLTVGLEGDAELTEAALPPSKALWTARIAEARVASNDPWRGLKSTERGLYDSARSALPEGVDELIFLNENGDLVEGAITNLFVPRGDVLLTPPLGAGTLPGVLRASLIAEGRVREARLTGGDLELGFFLGNALRGLIAARLG